MVRAQAAFCKLHLGAWHDDVVWCGFEPPCAAFVASSSREQKTPPKHNLEKQVEKLKLTWISTVTIPSALSTRHTLGFTLSFE